MQRSYRHDRHNTPVLDLRDAARRRALALPDLPALTPAERAAAVRTWRGRMVNEHVSAQVWGALVGQLMAAALPAAVLAGVAEAVADELRHAELCAAVVVALGGQPVAPLPPLAPVPAHPEVGPLEGALRNIISVGCMAETIAVALIRAEQAELEDSALGAVLGQILADEVAHARLGWRVLGQCAPLLDAPARARMGAYLAVAFAHQIAHELPLLPLGGPVGAAAARAGVCDGAFARQLFFDTFETVIVPGLDQVGLPATAAWQQVRPAPARRSA